MIGIIILTILSLILSIVLVFIDDKLNKKENRRNKIRTLLPGYNCGACGFGSCEGMCNAIMEDLDNYKKCKPLKNDALKNMEEYINKLKKKKV